MGSIGAALQVSGLLGVHVKRLSSVVFEKFSVVVMVWRCGICFIFVVRSLPNKMSFEWTSFIATK